MHDGDHPLRQHPRLSGVLEGARTPSSSTPGARTIRCRAYQFKNGRLQDAPKQSAFQPPLGMPGGMLSLTANGSTPGSGILWAVVPLDGDANKQRGVHGIVLALNAEDVSQTLWTSEQVPGPRSSRPVREVHATDGGRRQALRRDLWRQRAAARLRRQQSADAVSALRRRGLWRDGAAAAAADRQPGSRGCRGGARFDRTAHARHQDLQGRRRGFHRLHRCAQHGNRTPQPVQRDPAGRPGRRRLCAATRHRRSEDRRAAERERRRLLEQPGRPAAIWPPTIRAGSSPRRSSPRSEPER